MSTTNTNTEFVGFPTMSEVNPEQVFGKPARSHKPTVEDPLKPFLQALKPIRTPKPNIGLQYLYTVEVPYPVRVYKLQR